MDPLTILRTVAEMGLLLAISWPLVTFVRALASRGVGSPARLWLRVARGLVIVSLLLPLVGSTLIRTRSAGWAPVQVWSAPAGAGEHVARVTLGGHTGPFAPAAQGAPTIGRWIGLIAGIAALGCALRLCRLGLALRRLRMHLESLPVLRRICGVRVVVSEQAAVAFSARAGGSAWVVIPGAILANETSRRFAIAHELQHHRHRDTSRAIAFELLRAAFWWNPAVTRIGRALSAMEELSCDEALVARRSIDRTGYATCLVEAAGNLTRPQSLPFPVAAMAAHSRWLLKRRIEMIFRTDRRRSSSAVFAVVFTAVGILISGSLLARGAVADRRVSRAQAEELASSKNGSIPVKVSNGVLDEINRLAATPKARGFIKDGMARMAEYRPSIEKALADKGLPLDLLAVPLVESGFQNMDSSSKLPSMAPGMRGAGIWMFIPDTARHYGLRVDAERDDRLDPTLETRAAIELLSELHDRYGDWSLALAAYNQGDRAVDAAIAAGGTRDHAALIEAGHLNGYADTVMAAMLVLRNPQLVD